MLSFQVFYVVVIWVGASLATASVFAVHTVDKRILQLLYRRRVPH